MRKFYEYFSFRKQALFSKTKWLSQHNLSIFKWSLIYINIPYMPFYVIYNNLISFYFFYFAQDPLPKQEPFIVRIF